jgi:DNA invertase Pin-like site-specific DNA recombinase
MKATQAQQVRQIRYQSLLVHRHRRVVGPHLLGEHPRRHGGPMAKLMLTMLAGFCEFERELIRERQREGIAIAKAKGVYKGRKRALTPEQVKEIIEQSHAGIPKADLARAYSISRETLYQYLRDDATI